MKIAILTPTFSPYSGIDRVVGQRAEDLAQKGNRVVIFTFKADMRSRAETIVMGMPKKPFFERLYRLFFFFDFMKVKRYVNIVKGFDIVESHFYPMNIIAARAKGKNKKLKYIYWNYGVGNAGAYSFFERAYLRMFSYFSNSTIRNCDGVYSISDFLRRELLRETGINSRVSYLKIDKKRFRGVDNSLIKKRYNIKGPMFLYVGRISPHKGVHLLIRAFNIVRKKIPNARLVIVGKITFKGYYKKLKQIAGRDVIFTGFVSDEELRFYYAACNLYTTGTLWEGYDLPAVEAQEYGKKVVAFDIGAHPEVVKKGVLVKKGDVQAFAQAMLGLLK